MNSPSRTSAIHGREDVSNEMVFDLLRNKSMNISEELTDLLSAIDTFIDKLEETNLPQYAMLYRALYDAEEKLSKSLDKLSKKKEELKNKLLPELFEKNEVKTLTTLTGDRLTVTNKLYANIKKENVEQALDWLRENGGEDIIKETVNHNTLSAFLKSEMEENKEIPEELFSVYVQPSISLTRKKE